MKRGRPKKDKSLQVVKIVPSEFKRAMEESIRLSTQQSEYAGFNSRHVKGYCDRCGFPPKVFNWLRALAKMDHMTRDGHIRSFLAGLSYLEYDKQGDLFETIGDAIKEMTGEAASEPQEGTGPGIPLDEAQEKFEQAKAEADEKEAEKRERKAKAKAEAAPAAEPDDGDIPGFLKRTPRSSRGGETLDDLTSATPAGAA
jgi:hypothetical protein